MQLKLEPVFGSERLQQLHPCPEFDDHIVFDDSLQPNGEQAHDYYIDGEKWKPSVTTFVHSFFPSFDADRVIAGMMGNPTKWESGPYRGMTAEQIKDQWKRNGKEAGDLGTAMHAIIECFYNADEVERAVIAAEHPEPEFDYFLDFHREIAADWVPWRTELRVCNWQLRIAGSVDMLYLSPRSTPQQPLLIMYDWKRTKNLLSKPAHGRGLPPLSHLPNNDIFHYRLQLNVYKAFIERNTAYRIESMWLGVFHPNQSGYLSLEVPPMEKEIAAMFAARCEQLYPKPAPTANTLAHFFSSPYS